MLRHNSINSIVKRSLESAKVPSVLEPSGILRYDNKRPDGASMIPWSHGKLLLWDVTFPNTLCSPSYLDMANGGTGVVVDRAERKKKLKYACLSGRYPFIPIGIETFGSFGKEATLFFKSLCKRARLCSDYITYPSLTQNISMTLQNYNAISILETF